MTMLVTHCCAGFVDLNNWVGEGRFFLKLKKYERERVPPRGPYYPNMSLYKFKSLNNRSEVLNGFELQTKPLKINDLECAPNFYINRSWNLVIDDAKSD